jgi:CRISPR/Cas system Type II protein with McrA/HNH and RuvC-like nuclease domain
MQKMASQTSNHAAWFMARNFPNWLEYASEFDANMKRESDTILRISNEIFYDNITGYFQEVGISNMENKSKVVQFATTLFAEANAKMLKFCPQGIEPIQDVQFRKERGGKKGRAKRFYIPAVQQWISETCSEPIGSEEEILEEARNFPVGGGMAIGFQPGQRN